MYNLCSSRGRLSPKRWRGTYGPAFNRQCVLYARLDETGTGTRYDRSGRGTHLTNVNGATGTTGQVGGAANFVRASSQRLTSASADFAPSARFSFAAWFNVNDLAFQYMLSKGATSGNFGWMFYVQGGANFQVQFSANGTTTSGYNHSVGASVGWHFFALTYDAGTLRFTQDGTTNNFAGAPSPIFATSEVFSIGGFTGGFTDSKGDEIAYWRDRALTTTEVSQLRARGLAGLPMIP